MKILIAPYGDYRNWSIVNYVLGGKKYEADTSLKAISEKEKPDKVIVIASDTMMEPVFFNYNKGCNKIKNEVKEKCEKNGIDGCSVIVAPGTGSFSTKDKKYNIKSFEGKMSDYYYIVFKELAEELLKLLVDKSESEKIEFLVDITHGINYFTHFTIDAVKKLAGILRYKFNEVFIKIYNSEPYSKESSLLKIHRVQKEKILKEEALGVCVDKILSTKNSNLRSGIKEIDVDEKNINLFLASLFFNLPLLLAESFFKLKNMKNIVNRFYDKFYNSFKISENNIKREVWFDRGVASLVAVYFFIELFEDEFKEFNMPFTLNEYQKFSSKTLRSNIIASRELSNLRNPILEKKELCDGEWRALSYFLENYSKNTCKDNNINLEKRNILAHAGLNKEVICVKCSEVEIFLKYCEDCDEILHDTVIKLYRKEIE